MVIPVSGFLPVPLPMMIPFMGAQSLVIGKMFGEGFQYGKRKISAMSNEEFNKLTFEDMMSNARTELKASIPTINASLQDMDKMVEVVVNEFLKYIGLVTKTVLETTGEKAGALIEGNLPITSALLDAAAHAVGTHTHPVAPKITTFVPPTNLPISSGPILAHWNATKNSLSKKLSASWSAWKKIPATIQQKRRTTKGHRIIMKIVNVENPAKKQAWQKFKSIQAQLTAHLRSKKPKK